jgi:hypothetical protein
MSTVNRYSEKNRKDTMEIQTLHRDFSPGNPNHGKPTYIIFIHCVTLFTIQYTYRSQWHPKP